MYGNVCNVAYIGTFIYLLKWSVCVSVCIHVRGHYALNVFAFVFILLKPFFAVA